MTDKIDRAAAMERFPDGRQPWPPRAIRKAIAALPAVSAPVAVPDDHTLLALMLATEEMDNVQGWFRHWTTGDRPVSAWADDPEIAGNYHDAMARLPDFKAAFLAALPPAPDAVEALVKAAAAWERERCAKVAESYWSGIPESEVGEAVCDAVFAVAAAIRAGGKP
jgi:hypothetical protein